MSYIVILMISKPSVLLTMSKPERQFKTSKQWDLGILNAIVQQYTRDFDVLRLREVLLPKYSA